MTSLKPSEWAKLLERDGQRCVHCGATDGLAPHHRRNRGMGGSKALETASNLLLVCSWLNGQMESDAETAEMAKSHGWKLLSWQSPTKYPVWDEISQSMFWLADDYTRVQAGSES